VENFEFAGQRFGVADGPRLVQVSAEGTVFWGEYTAATRKQ
jgi:hypothetical protein